MLFLLVAGIPFVALTWLGWLLLEQDRALEERRARERLESAASLVCRELDRSLSALEDLLPSLAERIPATLAPDRVSVVFDAAGVVRHQSGLLPFLPGLPSQSEYAAGLFASAEKIEYGESDPIRASAIYRELARVPYLAGTGWARLAMSPDGRYLAFRSPVDEAQWTALRLLPATGGELRELGRFLQSETEDVRELPWTPDGRNVLIVRRTGQDSMPELWRIPIAGGEPQRTGLSMESMGIVAPHPDGRRIAFESGNPSVEARELWVLENIPGATSSKTIVGGK